MKVKLWVDTGYSGIEIEDIIEVPDDTPDAELDKEAKEFRDERIEYGWEKIQ